MNQVIDAIFLDVGNTMRVVIKDQELTEQARKGLMTVLQTEKSEADFFEGLESRWQVYRKQAKELLVEASEKELWTKWLLPDYPTDRIAPLSGKLTRLWRDRSGRRIPRPGVKDTLQELHRRGYKLGVIANTITENEIPDWIESDGLTNYFQEVILSSKVGIRKPNPEIFWEAARRVGVTPSKCAYVGDNPVYDVSGSRQAGFGLTVLIMESGSQPPDAPTNEHKPDYVIQEMMELLDIFPSRG